MEKEKDNRAYGQESARVFQHILFLQFITAPVFLSSFMWRRVINCKWKECGKHGHTTEKRWPTRDKKKDIMCCGPFFLSRVARPKGLRPTPRLILSCVLGRSFLSSFLCVNGQANERKWRRVWPTRRLADIGGRTELSLFPLHNICPPR